MLDIQRDSGECRSTLCVGAVMSVMPRSARFSIRDLYLEILSFLPRMEHLLDFPSSNLARSYPPQKHRIRPRSRTKGGSCCKYCYRPSSLIDYEKQKSQKIDNSCENSVRMVFFKNSSPVKLWQGSKPATNCLPIGRLLHSLEARVAAHRSQCDIRCQARQVTAFKLLREGFHSAHGSSSV